MWIIFFKFVRLNGLVIIVQMYHPIPFRTRTWSSVALMVLHLKVWESKTLPGLLASQIINKHDAGWSSPVARQAHNLKVVGSNPTPATNLFNKINDLYNPQRLRFLGFFCVLWSKISKKWLIKWLMFVRHISLL